MEHRKKPLAGGLNSPDNSNVGAKPKFAHQCTDPNLYKNKKKRRNSHLDRKVQVNGHDFNISRAQVEKKTPI